jgi:hypothetical protein
MRPGGFVDDDQHEHHGIGRAVYANSGHSVHDQGQGAGSSRGGSHFLAGAASIEIATASV